MAAHNSLLFCLVGKTFFFFFFCMCVCVLESNHKAVRESCELFLKDMAVLRSSTNDLDVTSKPWYMMLLF